MYKDKKKKGIKQMEKFLVIDAITLEVVFSADSFEAAENWVLAQAEYDFYRIFHDEDNNTVYDVGKLFYII